MLSIYIQNVLNKKMAFGTSGDKSRLERIIKNHFPENKISITQSNILIYESNKKPKQKEKRSV